MAGARLVLNARYFHIARAGEKADGKHIMTKDAAMGLVNYVGTREGVQLNTEQLAFEGVPLNLDPLKLDAAVAARPATTKQIHLIADLLHEIPEAKNSLEYQDFKENPTIINASELISHAAELGLGYAFDEGKAKNIVDYVANRPGVDRVGEHGLFSSAPSVDLKKAQEEIANCKGNIWTQVISLRREDADRLGYDQQKPWRDLVNAKIDTIAKAMNIPISELHWYAGMHNTTHHPHIHLFVFSDNPKAGRLTVDGINKIKSAFSEVIFADERRHIYDHKDEIRAEIKQKADDILSHLQDNASGQFSQQDMKLLCEKLMKLSQDLKGRTGKMQYGWIKDLNILRQVNDIMSDLTKAPDIQKLYELYCEDHKELQRMYRNDPKDLSALVKLREFKSIKNRIIREALRFSNIFPEYEPGSPEESQTASPEEFSDANKGRTPEDELSLFEFVPEGNADSAPQEDYETYEDFIPVTVPESDKTPARHRVRPSEMDSSDLYAKAFDGDPSARYQLARRYFYGNGVDRDYTRAQMWYGLAAAEGYSLAKYELGKMYLYGIGIDKDHELGTEYCKDAFSDFTFELHEATGVDVEGSTFRCEDLQKTDYYHAYLEYLAGRMRLAGEGAEKDNVLACSWFRAAAWHEHVHAKYMLAKMYYDGKGVPQDYSFALGLYKEAADSEDKYACYAAGRMYFCGVGTAQDYDKAAAMFMKASKENVPYADYVLAEMAKTGLGMDTDEEAAGILYQKALKEFEEQEKQQPDPLTECRIAFQYLLGKGVNANAGKAAVWFQKAAEQDNPQADYQLAALYASGTGVPEDLAKASVFYAKALRSFLEAEKANPEAGQEYRIAQMYEKGLGTEENTTEMTRWFTIAAEHGHGHAAYRLGKLFLDPASLTCDISAGLKWLQTAADLKDKYAYYALGKIYHDGILSERNFTIAAKWLRAASDANLPYASYLLAEQYRTGQGVSPDPKIAYSLYSKALSALLTVERNKPEAMLEYRIGGMYLHGKGVAENPPEALRWFELSAGKGNAFAAYQAAELYSEGKAVPKDGAKAQNYFAATLAGFLQIEKDAPDEMMEYRIGGIYLHGKGVAENPAEALRWFEISAGKGNIFAAYEAALLLESGQSVPRNPIRAQIYFNQALNGFIKADLVSPDANLEYRIGQMFFQGKGTAVNVPAAMKWLAMSSDKKNPYAQFQLAGIYQKGEWIPQNMEYARGLYLSALDGFQRLLQQQPDSSLQYRIGAMYERGLGVDRNMSAAKFWYSLAADAGNELAAERLNQIAAFESQAAVSSIFNLFRSLARQMSNSISDSTTHRFRPERKLLQKQRKMAHSQEQTG